MKKLLIIPLILLLTGCWNYRELNQLAITTGIAIDKEDDNYKVTIMIANSKKDSGSDGSITPSAAVYDGTGQTIYEAFKDTSLSVSKQIYLSHIDVLVLSEEIASNSLIDVIDFLFRYPQTRNNFYLVLAKDKSASDILKVTTPLETFPSQNLAKNLEITDKLQGFTYTVDFTDFTKSLVSEGINPVLPSVTIIGSSEEGNKEDNIKQNEPSTYLKLDMLGLFKDDKFVAWASPNESKGINIINNKIYILGVIIDYQDEKIVTEITEMETSFKVEDNKVKITIDTKGAIQEINAKVDLYDPKIIEEIKNVDIEKIKQYVNEAINLAKNNKTDIFGFGNYVYKNDPQRWKEIKDIWDDEIFPSLEIEIEVNLKLQAKGSINDTVEVRE